MKTAGNVIRHARLAKNMTLKELHRTTRITLPILKAIENGDETGLPAATIRGFVRSICSELGIDVQKVLPYLPDAGQPLKRPAGPMGPVTAAKPLLRWLLRPGTVIFAVVLCITAAIYVWYAPGGSPGPPDMPLFSVSMPDTVQAAGPAVLADSAKYYAPDMHVTPPAVTGPDTSLPVTARTAQNDTAVIVTGRIPLDEINSILPGFNSLKEQARIDSSIVEKLEQLNPRISILVFFGTWDRLSVQAAARIAAVAERAFLPGVTVSTVGVDRDMHDPGGLSDLHAVSEIPCILFVVRGAEQGRVSGLAGETDLYSIENELVRIARDTEIFIKAEYDEIP